MNARKLAYECLKQVILKKQYANLVLRERLQQVDEKERNLVTQITYGTLRNNRLCRFQWQGLAKGQVQDTVKILLDMSVYQLFLMDRLPAYAIVNETVKITPHSAKKFVNAILRKVIEQGFLDSENVAIKTSHPEWMVKLWSAHYGEEVAREIAFSNSEEAKVIGRINSLKISKEELEGLEGIHFIDNFAFKSDFNLIHHELFEEGKVVIQDFSSQQVVQFLDVKPNMRVLDCCAAPGTKTSQLAMMMGNQGEILAGDIHPHRVELINQLMEKMGVTIVESRVWDATELNEQLGLEGFDRILVDVPCSGLGVLKRKPEIKWTCTPEGIDEICAIQAKILSSAGKFLRKEGIMVYSTCTLNKKENEKQIQRFLEENPRFECVEEKTLFPYQCEGDGFYLAKIVKK